MDAIDAYLHENQTRLVEELCDYIRFPSVSAQPQHRADVAACAEWLLQHCLRLGLKARLCPTAGPPVVLAKTFERRTPGRRHFLVYGHYDVQPADPFELWTSPPFEPRLEGRSLYGRGAADNKGQHLAHLNAVEAYRKTGVELPVDLTFVIEGEEEVGSAHLAGFLREHRAELRADAVVISDTSMPSRKHPALTYALRGIAALEVQVKGPSRDLHSGLYGGAVDNPAMVLCQMLAQLRDPQGRIAIPGIYDEVQKLTPFERRQLARLPYSKSAFKKLTGVPELFGERGFTVWEQRTARPTLEINGLTSGYQGDGSKTIVPAWARAKLTFRLVPDQKPDRVLKLAQAHLRRLCPPTARLTLTPGHGGKPYWVSPESPFAQAALRSLQAAFGCEPVLLREGGSIPILNDLKSILHVDALLLGLSLPDDNPHAPNEKFDLDCFAGGMRLSARLWQELA